MAAVRILYLHQYFNTPKMPGGTRSFEMARRLAARGHEVHIITSERREDRSTAGLWRTTDEEGIHVHWTPVPYANRMATGPRLVSFGRFAWRAAWRAVSVGGDVVFASSTPLTIAIPGVFAAWQMRVPMVLEVRDLWPEVPIAMGALRDPVTRSAARALERFAYRNAARVIALGPGMADGVAATGYPRERIATIPNSADLARFEPTMASDQRFLTRFPQYRGRRIIAYTGALGKANGLGYAVDIAARLGDLDPSAALVIFGDGAERPSIVERARKLGLLGVNVFVHDPIPKDQIPDVLAAATVATSFFLPDPALRNNSPNKFFDALAAGRPVAINHGGWLADLVVREQLGVVLDERDATRAAKQLCDLMSDASGLAATGRRARIVAERQFSRDVLALQLESELLTAVGQAR